MIFAAVSYIIFGMAYTPTEPTVTQNDRSEALSSLFGVATLISPMAGTSVSVYAKMCIRDSCLPYR